MARLKNGTFITHVCVLLGVTLLFLFLVFKVRGFACVCLSYITLLYAALHHFTSTPCHTTHCAVCSLPAMRTL